MSLFSRLALAMAAVVIATAVTIGLISALTLKSFVTPRALQRMELHLLVLSADMRQAVDGAGADLRALQQASGLQGILRARRDGGVDPETGWTDAVWRRQLSNLFAAELEAKRAYLQLRVIEAAHGTREIVRVDRSGPEGEVRIVSDDELQTKGDRDYVGQTMTLPIGALFVSPFDLNQEFGAIERPFSPVVRVAMPIADGRGGTFGILVVNIDMKYFLDAIREQNGSSRRIYLVNARGDLLLAPDASREFAFELGGQARLQDDFPSLADPIERHRSFQGVVEDREGETFAITLLPFSLAGLRSLAIAEVVPYREFMAVAGTTERSIMIGAALAAAAAIALAVLLARSQIKPLQRITLAAQAMERGEAIDLPLDAAGEIGILARAFDRMAREVGDKAASLSRAITENEKTIAQLHEQSRRLKLFTAALEGSDDAILIHDLDGRIQTWNRAAETLYGYSAEEAIGNTTEFLVPPERIEELYKNLARVRNGERIDHFETIRVAKDGRRIDVSLSISPVEADDGTPIGASKIARDITARKESEAAIAASTEELRRSNAELEEFAYVAAHDLQEPLRMVASYTELLAQRYEGQLDERADKYIHYAVEGAKRMKSLISDLLVYSRLGAQGKPLEPVSVDMILDGVEQRMHRLIEETDTVIERSPMPIVMGDDIQLGQVFQNLVGNAVKFRSDQAPRISIGARREGAMWRFSVSDNGIGIEPQHAERVFQMFQSLHERGRYEGSGIGLAVAKKIVERHGGRIGLQSEPGKGSTFFFTVPADAKEL
ncbi:sensor histidine kinase [Consotaella aegiceratis]|uniref:sensor histidine kinase n=1 Tax=Consotaella aegiceratis TaxID=3097961 RepID=UPI002F3ECE35